jgi:hypothetical protein
MTVTNKIGTVRVVDCSNSLPTASHLDMAGAALAAATH